MFRKIILLLIISFIFVSKGFSESKIKPLPLRNIKIYTFKKYIKKEEFIGMLSSPDKRNIAILVKSKNKQFIIIFSPDGDKIAYVL